jgi:hypothetical protein
MVTLGYFRFQAYLCLNLFRENFNIHIINHIISGLQQFAGR